MLENRKLENCRLRGWETKMGGKETSEETHQNKRVGMKNFFFMFIKKVKKIKNKIAKGRNIIEVTPHSLYLSDYC